MVRGLHAGVHHLVKLKHWDIERAAPDLRRFTRRALGDAFGAMRFLETYDRADGFRARNEIEPRPPIRCLDLGGYWLFFLRVEDSGDFVLLYVCPVTEPGKGARRSRAALPAEEAWRLASRRWYGI